MNQVIETPKQNVSLGDGYVPVIDISPYFNGSDSDKRHVAAEIGRACREVGFYIITGHGVPEAMVDGIDKAARDFFDLPLEEKMALSGTEAGAVGYAGMGARSLAYTRGEKTPPDLHESYQISKIDADMDSAYFQ